MCDASNVPLQTNDTILCLPSAHDNNNDNRSLKQQAVLGEDWDHFSAVCFFFGRQLAENMQVGACVLWCMCVRVCLFACIGVSFGRQLADPVCVGE